MSIENKTIEERLNNIEHQLKVLVKGQQQIKSHLWKEGSEQLGKSREAIEAEAIHYIHNVVIPELAQKETAKGEMVAQGVWVAWAARPIVEFLKVQALEFIGKALEELKNQLIPLAIDIAEFVLNELQGLIINQYNNASEEARNIFKNKIIEKFPNSDLIHKLN